MGKQGRGKQGRILVTAGMAIVAGGAAAQPAGQRTGPIATYWVSAQTTSGMMAGGGQGGRPSNSAMMSMMMGGRGGGANYTHTLTLQLGSQQKPQGGAPEADHLPPQGLGAGPSLPLLTPRQVVRERTEEPTMPQDYKPKGRMLVFWGCGDHAKPGQPLVIDFAKVAAGQMPPGFAALSRGLAITPMQPPSQSRSATYGEWPNEQTRTTVPPQGSLVGSHVVSGNYSPEISFTLGASQDFLGPLQITANAKTALGSSALAWRGLAGAQAYMATAMGGGEDDTVVMWSSSEVQASAFALPDYLSPGDITRLVANKALLGPQTTSCTIPKEVVDSMSGGMVQLAAYGGEANFSYPPRPADPKVRYVPDWVVKVRYKSTTGTLMGMADMMGGMGSDDGEDSGPPQRRGQQQPQQQQRRPGLGDMMRGMGGF
jgi:hypothetical protein